MTRIVRLAPSKRPTAWGLLTKLLSFSALLGTALLIGIVIDPVWAQTHYQNPAGIGVANAGKALMLYQRAMQAFQMGDNNGCIQLCRQAMIFNHGDKNIVHLLALAFAESGDNYNANMQFRAALTLDYNFIECRNNYGMFMKKTGKVDEAKKAFEECIKINPRYPFAYHHLGEIYQERGDLEKAIECYNTACRIKPDYFEAQRDLGLAIYERYERGDAGDISESIDKLRIAAQLMPQNPMIHYHLGNIWCANGKLDDGEAEFRKALMIDPKLAAAHWELAKLRYFRGDCDRALSEVKLVEKISPVYTDGKKYPKVDPLKLKYTKAMCEEFIGDKIQAVDDWKEVAALQANNAETVKHITDLEKILRAAAKGRGKKPVIAYDAEEVQALITKGIGQVDNGDLEGAKVTFQRALELNPQSFQAMQNLGAIAEAQGNLSQAMSKYQEAMNIQPNFDGLYYNFAYLLEKLNLPTDAGNMYAKFHEIAGRYPYDPKHIVQLQQEEARQRMREEQKRKRGY